MEKKTLCGYRKGLKSLLTLKYFPKGFFTQKIFKRASWHRRPFKDIRKITWPQKSF